MQSFYMIVYYIIFITDLSKHTVFLPAESLIFDIVKYFIFYCFIHRNVLLESARIARGNIKALSDLNAPDFDAIVFPGGFGAAKNL